MADRIRIAYLTTQYPAVSHSFIRREVAAMEAAGAMISRFSIRAAPMDLPDERDREEAARTTYILPQGPLALATAGFLSLMRKPAPTLRALGCALGMYRKSGRGLARHLAYLAEAAWLLPQLEKAGVTHVHVHFGTNPAAVARLLRRMGGLSYSFTVHGPDEFDNPNGLDLKGKLADALAGVTISSFGRSQLMRWSAFEDWRKILVARCGIDDAFRDASLRRPAPTAPHLCCVARLSAQKGLPLLIEAAGKLKARGGDFQLTLVGDGEMRPVIEEQIARLGLTGSVSITGWASSEDVRKTILSSRAMILPSFAEGLPVVIMEALALGRPVVASRIAGTPELVDETCGWLIPAGDVDAIAVAMEQALSASSETIEAMGAEGRRRVLADHDATANGAALLKQLIALKAKEVSAP